MLRGVLLLAVAAGLLVTPPAAHAVVVCPVVAYPGDDAAKADIAVWLAGGAAARGVPGELPVMAALVESGLANLDHGPADSVGYFQMRRGIWDRGEYAGYPANPELQLDWFLDQATAVRTPPYPDETGYGEWAADVERPAEQNRYKYQLRLAEARGLIGSCTAADTTAPATEVTGRSRQAARRVLRVEVGCPAEACTVDVRARVRVGRQRELAAPAVALAAGQVATFEVRLMPSVRRLVGRALRLDKKVRADLTVTTTDAVGNAGVTTKRVRISR